MKKLTLILLALFLFSFSVNQTIQIIQPAKPKEVIVKVFLTKYKVHGEVASFCKRKIKEGYILKSMSGTNDSSYISSWIVVLEKY